MKKLLVAALGLNAVAIFLLAAALSVRPPEAQRRTMEASSPRAVASHVVDFSRHASTGGSEGTLLAKSRPVSGSSAVASGALSSYQQISSPADSSTEHTALTSPKPSKRTAKTERNENPAPDGTDNLVSQYYAGEPVSVPGNAIALSSAPQATEAKPLLPASMADHDPAKVPIATDQQVVEWEGLQDDFVAEVGGTEPSDTAGNERWQSARLANDEVFRAKFGWQAFVQQSLQAYIQQHQ